MDPDPHEDICLDPAPRQNDADPKHWLKNRNKETRNNNLPWLGRAGRGGRAGR